MNHKKLRIGIWGYGIVGKAVAHYFFNQGHHVGIMDKQDLSHIDQKKYTVYNEKDKINFFSDHDYIVPSPGVNIVADYATYKSKWLIEFDAFQQLFAKKIIAITGSIGKTSVTTIISSLLHNAGIAASTGGNIGFASFNLLAQKDTIDYAVLEVSSFQLQYCQSFAPHLAIWTNLHPNHLDHHETEDNYFDAKYAILAQQTDRDNAIIHLDLRKKLKNKTVRASCAFFCTSKPEQSIFDELKKNESVYYSHDNTIIRYHDKAETTVVTLSAELKHFSFLENVILLAAACTALGIDAQLLNQLPKNTTLPPHRLEFINTINNVDFYNDSKSTTTVSTSSAVKALAHRPLHLFLGGLSKGVDRKQLIADIQPYVHSIYCFGKEADTLYNYCQEYAIPAYSYANLEDAFNACHKHTKPHDIVLLSPSGSSYDLYNNFEERGDHFKSLVSQLSTSE